MYPSCAKIAFQFLRQVNYSVKAAADYTSPPPSTWFGRVLAIHADDGFKVEKDERFSSLPLELLSGHRFGHHLKKWCIVRFTPFINNQTKLMRVNWLQSVIKTNNFLGSQPLGEMMIASSHANVRVPVRWGRIDDGRIEGRLKPNVEKVNDWSHFIIQSFPITFQAHKSNLYFFRYTPPSLIFSLFIKKSNNFV